MMSDAGAPAARRVLVVDDEPTIRAALRRYFQRMGWEIEEAADGQSALDKLLAGGAEDYHAVICDLRMPVSSGAELHRRLLEERPALAARMIFSTGDVGSAEAAAFLASTNRPVLEKPFELAVLGEVLRGME